MDDKQAPVGSLVGHKIVRPAWGQVNPGVGYWAGLVAATVSFSLRRTEPRVWYPRFVAVIASECLQ